jgi:hypothetical protein
MRNGLCAEKERHARQALARFARHTPRKDWPAILELTENERRNCPLEGNLAKFFRYSFPIGSTYHPYISGIFSLLAKGARFI